MNRDRPPYWKEEWLFFLGALYYKFRQGGRYLNEQARRRYYGYKYRTVEDAARSVLKDK